MNDSLAYGFPFLYYCGMVLPLPIIFVLDGKCRSSIIRIEVKNVVFIDGTDNF